MQVTSKRKIVINRLGIIFFAACLLYCALFFFQYRAVSESIDYHVSNDVDSLLMKFYHSGMTGSDLCQINSNEDLTSATSKFNELGRKFALLGLTNESRIQLLVISINELDALKVDAGYLDFIKNTQLTFNDDTLDFELLYHYEYDFIAPLIAVSIMTSILILLLFIFPYPNSLNKYPKAKFLSLVFDRKVSAGKGWGFWALSHLGGGSQIPNIDSNNWEACNENSNLDLLLNQVKKTYNLAQRNIYEGEGSHLCSQLDEVFESAGKMIRQSTPVINNSDDVFKVFFPWMRTVVFGDVIIDITNKSKIGRLCGIAPNFISIGDEAMWLTGSLEIYMPRSDFSLICDEINSGLMSAYGKGVENVVISSNPTSPFIDIDYIASVIEIDKANNKRIKQYLSSSYQGGLELLASRVRGYGELIVYDKNYGYDIVNRKKSSLRCSKGITWRFRYRRVFPGDEAAMLIQFYEKELLK
jgi:hypothetical protein